MIITLGLDYSVSLTSLSVRIESPADTILLDLTQQTSTVHLKFDLTAHDQVVNLKFHCNDLNIVNHPVTITDIVLDDFYQSNSILYRGKPKFDQQFLSLAAEKNMYLDHKVNDSNCLDFTGVLEYEFAWPFYKNIFK